MRSCVAMRHRVATLNNVTIHGSAAICSIVATHSREGMRSTVAMSSSIAAVHSSVAMRSTAVKLNSVAMYSIVVMYL